MKRLGPPDFDSREVGDPESNSRLGYTDAREHGITYHPLAALPENHPAKRVLVLRADVNAIVRVVKFPGLGANVTRGWERSDGTRRCRRGYVEEPKRNARARCSRD